MPVRRRTRWVECRWIAGACWGRALGARARWGGRPILWADGGEHTPCWTSTYDHHGVCFQKPPPKRRPPWDSDAMGFGARRGDRIASTSWVGIGSPSQQDAESPPPWAERMTTNNGRAVAPPRDCGCFPPPPRSALFFSSRFLLAPKRSDGRTSNPSVSKCIPAPPHSQAAALAHPRPLHRPPQHTGRPSRSDDGALLPLARTQEAGDWNTGLNKIGEGLGARGDRRGGAAYVMAWDRAPPVLLREPFQSTLGWRGGLDRRVPFLLGAWWRRIFVMKHGTGGPQLSPANST